jgi:hypothetical protein
MPNRKVLRSVIHNLAHSFLSALGYVDGDYIYEHLRRKAEETGVPHIVLDALNGTIDPPAFRTEALMKAAGALPRQLEHLIVSGGAGMSLVQAAEITIDFDLAREPIREVVDGGGILVKRDYRCEGRIIDDQGHAHAARVATWWNY